MIPSQFCILQSTNRYFWLYSIAYKSEQLLTFIEVNREVKQQKIWAKDRWGKNTNESYFVEVANHSIRAYENGIYVVTYPRSILEDRIKENKVRVVDLGVKINISDKEDLQIKINELNYGK